MVNKSKELVKKLPIIKPHLDLIAAILTIPVLITVFILNYSTLTKGKSNQLSPSPQFQNQQLITAVPVKSHSTTPTPTDSPSCKSGIGEVTISDPSEGAVINTNPVCVTIDYASQGYCSVVWAYKVNGGPLSDYSNNSVCLYNMPGGQVTFTLYVKSLVGNQTQTLVRSFQANPLVSPSSTQITTPATMSATPTSNP